MADHPVKVPLELVRQWLAEFYGTPATPSGCFGEATTGIANCAAQWGWNQREHEVQEQADQDLEAVEHWLITGPYGASIAASAPNLVADLRSAMRPKPPTLVEQGLEALRSTPCTEQRHYDALFACINRLAELEAQQ